VWAVAGTEVKSNPGQDGELWRATFSWLACHEAQLLLSSHGACLRQSTEYVCSHGLGILHKEDKKRSG
jgi:hypothetical protein